jgi:hypothetical protein
VKKRIDTLLFKNLEFKTISGQKVKITDIPVLSKASPHYYKVNIRLHQFINQIQASSHLKTSYSFRDYLKKVLKWPEYELIYKTSILKNNA